MRVWILFLTLTTLLSCKESTQSSSTTVDGKYVRSIGRNTIQFEDGSKYTFPSDSTAKIVYVIRHAEKDTSTKDNPLLSPAGEVRAKNLKHILQGTRIDKVLSTMYNRTIFTVSNVASAKGINIEPYKPAGMKKLADDIRSGQLGDRFLIVGHSNTTKSMANVLVQKNYFTEGIDEKDYDNFIVVVLTENDFEVLSLKYK